MAKDIRADFKLEPGGVNETVTVSEEAPIVETTNDVLGGTFSNKAINELPLLGRDFQNLAVLQPGIQRTPGGGFLSVTANGNRPNDNNYIVDGLDDNDAYYGTTVINAEGVEGTPATHLPIDAIQEFNVQSSPEADYGWKPGAIINIGIKSGTNSFHGSTYYFNRNSALDARNWFNPGPDPVAALNFHQFGASAGGPIIKNKLFIFGNYEAVRDVVGNPLQVDVPVSVPNGDPTSSIADAFAECTANSNCSSVSQNLAKFFPINPGPDVAIESGLEQSQSRGQRHPEAGLPPVRKKQFDRHLLHRGQRADRGRHDGGKSAVPLSVADSGAGHRRRLDLEPNGEADQSIPSGLQPLLATGGSGRPQ